MLAPLVVVGPELTQPTYRRLVEAGQMHDVLDREPLRKKPLDRGRGRDLRIRHRLHGQGPLLPGDLDVDRCLVDAPLSG